MITSESSCIKGPTNAPDATVSYDAPVPTPSPEEQAVEASTFSVDDSTVSDPPSQGKASTTFPGGASLGVEGEEEEEVAVKEEEYIKMGRTNVINRP